MLLCFSSSRDLTSFGTSVQLIFSILLRNHISVSIMCLLVGYHAYFASRRLSVRISRRTEIVFMFANLEGIEGFSNFLATFFLPVWIFDIFSYLQNFFSIKRGADLDGCRFVVLFCLNGITSVLTNPHFCFL